MLVDVSLYVPPAADADDVGSRLAEGLSTAAAASDSLDVVVQTAPVVTTAPLSPGGTYIDGGLISAQAADRSPAIRAAIAAAAVAAAVAILLVVACLVLRRRRRAQSTARTRRPDGRRHKEVVAAWPLSPRIPGGGGGGAAAVTVHAVTLSSTSSAAVVQHDAFAGLPVVTATIVTEDDALPPYHSNYYPTPSVGSASRGMEEVKDDPPTPAALAGGAAVALPRTAAHSSSAGAVDVLHI